MFIKKTISKRRKDGSGFVCYSSQVCVCGITVNMVNELYAEIKKDFPNITEEHVEIRFENNHLCMDFFTFNLPSKGSGLFDEEQQVSIKA